MNFSDYLEQIKEIQENLLDFIDSKDNIEEHLQNFLNFLKERQICNNIHDFKLFIHFLASISNNHSRNSYFHYKIEQILKTYEKYLKKHFTNSEIFKMFLFNKMILLFLFQEKIIFIDEDILNIIQKNIYDLNEKKHYGLFFLPEIRPFMTENPHLHYSFYSNNTKLDLNKIEENRKIGENPSYICELIRKDSIDDFIIHVNKNNISFNSLIKTSPYETNSFLIDNSREITLIQYAAFFGSRQIYQYLRQNQAKIESSIWLYAIHGRNAEIIHLIEEDQIKPINESYENCLIESIKCNHNEIANYIYERYLSNKINNVIAEYSFQFFNFNFINNNIDSSDFLFFSCKYDYYVFVDSFLKNESNVKPKILNKEFVLKEDNYYVNYTPLSFAIINNNADIVKLLVSTNMIDVNHILKKRKTDGREEDQILQTGLIMAIFKGNVEIIKALLSDKKIDVNIPYKIINKQNYLAQQQESVLERTPLNLAMENIEIFKLLLANKNVDVNRLSKKYIDGFQNSQSFMNGITYYTHNYEDYSLLCLALNSKHFDITKLLLENEKLDINMRIKTSTCKNPKVKNTKHTRGPTDEVDTWIEKENTLLCWAIEKNDIQTVQLLLSNNKIDVNKPCIKSERLRGKEKDFEIKETPLIVAIKDKNIDMIKLLLGNENIDVNFQYEHIKYNKHHELISKKTALCFAIERDDINIVKLLLSTNKIDVNALNIEKHTSMTALHKAVLSNNKEIIQILLNYQSIDINIKDNLGRKPIQLTKDQEIIDLFPEKHEDTENTKLLSEIEELKRENAELKKKQSIFQLESVDSKSIKSMQFVNKIGNGKGSTFSTVSLNKLYVLKEVSKENIQQLKNEFEMMNMLHHPNVQKAHNIFIDDPKRPPSILLEYFPYCIGQAIQDKILSNVQKVFAIYQIAEGMKYIHSRNIVHQNLRLANIMISDDGIIKIGGFRKSHLITSENISDKDDDVYSFGVIVQFILNLNKSEDSHNEPSELAKLLINSCCKNKERPSFIRICELLEEKEFKLIQLSQQETKIITQIIDQYKKQC